VLYIGYKIGANQWSLLFASNLRLRDKLKLVFDEPPSIATLLLLAAMLPVQQIMKFFRVPVGWSGCSPREEAIRVE